jgi:hypothetical protein
MRFGSLSSTSLAWLLAAFVARDARAADAHSPGTTALLLQIGSAWTPP